MTKNVPTMKSLIDNLRVKFIIPTFVMMTPTTLKDWDFVKTKVHDISGVSSPEFYYYQFNNGIYYPAVRKVDLDNIPEPKNKKRI